MTPLPRATAAERRQARRDADTLAQAYRLSTSARNLLSQFLLWRSPPPSEVTDELVETRAELAVAGLVDVRLVPLAPDLVAVVCDIAPDHLRDLARAARAVAAATEGGEQ